MAAPKKSRGPAGGQGRPGRSLALILIAMVALTGGMFLADQPTPRLGIDLAGGTSITLEAKSEPGQESAINKTNMDTAVQIMERRVNGLGVSEAEVQTQGDRNIIVNIPKGTNSAQAREQVGTTAKLYFRPVLTVAQGTPTPTPSASSSGKPTPSGSPSAPTADKGKGSSSPDPSATTQGRAVTGALKADATPKASTTPRPTPHRRPPPPTRPPRPSCRRSSRPSTAPARRPAPRPHGAKPTDAVVACSSEGDAKYILGPSEVSGTEVDNAKAGFDQSRGMWIVNMEFTKQGSKQFQTITKKLSAQQSPQNQFAIALDGEVVSAPQVNTTLSGSAEISGSFTQQSAEDLANVLSYGALPLSFKEQSVTTVTAALGGEQLQAGLIAGAIGLALVVVYLVAYYRGLALIALLSLLVSGILTYTLMSLLGPAIGFALNLPAVCGAIVAIGITADSFIVYFERVRDEIREGRTLRPAVERAWPRARRTILVSDFVSFLAAAVLFVVTVGKVQGFAFTLGLTTLLDVVVVFLFTKPVMTLMARTKFFAGGHPWSGLDPKRLGAKPPLRRSRRVNAPTDPKEA